MGSTQTLETDQPDAKVLRWRFEELRRAGFDTEDAKIVAADARIDLHVATRLLRDGCPPQTALRILL